MGEVSTLQCRSGNLADIEIRKAEASPTKTTPNPVGKASVRGAQRYMAASEELDSLCKWPRQLLADCLLSSVARDFFGLQRISAMALGKHQIRLSNWAEIQISL